MTCLNRAPPNSGGYYVESRHCPSLCDQQVRSLTAHIRCLRIIAHRGFERLVAHPVLYGARIKTGSQHACRVRGAECLQIKFVDVEVCALRDVLALVEHVKVAIARGRRKDEAAGSVMRMLFNRSIKCFGTGTSLSSQRFG